jgi:hypothetical protein
MTRKRWRAVLLVTAGLLVGYVIGPPVVHAATSLVTIQGAGSTYKAKVTKQGRLFVDTEAGTFGDYLKTFASTFPDGATVIAGGTSSSGQDIKKNGVGTVTGVEVDVPPGPPANPIRVQLVRVKDGQVIWQGTVMGTGGHLNDQMVAGFFIPPNDPNPSLEIVIDDSSGIGYQFVVYGDGWGASFSRARR